MLLSSTLWIYCWWWNIIVTLFNLAKVVNRFHHQCPTFSLNPPNSTNADKVAVSTIFERRAKRNFILFANSWTYNTGSPNPIFFIFCNCLNPHHTPGASDQELCFSGRRIRWEDQNMMQCLKMYINDQRRRMKFLSKYEMIGGKIRELIDTKYSRKPASQPSGAIQVLRLEWYWLIMIKSWSWRWYSSIFSPGQPLKSTKMQFVGFIFILRCVWNDYFGLW